MSELTETEIINKISAIDVLIESITATLGADGAQGAQNVSYKIGNKSVDGSQRLEQLIKARELYQGMLSKIPKVIIRDHGMQDLGPKTGTGESSLEFIGD